MSGLSLSGLIPAVITPFAGDERVDYSAWQALLESLAATGVDGLLIHGHEGEWWALSEEERVVGMRYCLQSVGGRKPLLINVGAQTTGESVRLAHAAEAEGLGMLVVTAPSAIPVSPEEFTSHLLEICGSVRIPVLVYRRPGDLTPDAAQRLAAETENFAGVIDAGTGLGALRTWRDAAARPISVFTAADGIVRDAIASGADGAVVAGAGLAPEMYAELVRAAHAGRLDDAARLQELAAPLAALFAVYPPALVLKETLRLAGIAGGACRRPLSAISGESLDQVSAVVARLREERCLPESAAPAGNAA
ncbi:MAG: dihydrodipicolinate synthase family protein [Bryobacterales bacterium]|nr:dihydrodipicolinate synthase family protein [Bryobacterales bacterium]